MKPVIRMLLIFLFLPIFLLIDAVKSKKSIPKKIMYFILVLLIFGSIWFNAYGGAVNDSQIALYHLGITDKVTKVHVVGASMLPTIKNDSYVDLNSPNKYGLERGDIVSFKNKETLGDYYIKRIVGLSNENINIKNGYVLINGKALKEDYVLNQLPTFGSTFLNECSVYKIPDNSYAVLGDNRTVSSDSRVIGFVKKDEIDGVIKTHINTPNLETDNQAKIFKSNIDPQKFLKQLNALRLEDNSNELVTYPGINNLAQKRADQINSHFSDWKNKTIPAEKMLEDDGYRFNLVHEDITFGYLNEDQIVKQILESKTEKENFLSPQYTEVGIGVSERHIGDCTYPVIAIILSWPSVPTYSQADIDSWNKDQEFNDNLLSSLQTYVGISAFDQVKLRELIDLTAQESIFDKKIYNKMKNRIWLTSQDFSDIDNYNTVLVKKQEEMLNDLFGEVKGAKTQKLPSSK